MGETCCGRRQGDKGMTAAQTHGREKEKGRFSCKGGEIKREKCEKKKCMTCF
jgi:hypothetical protein